MGVYVFFLRASAGLEGASLRGVRRVYPPISVFPSFPLKKNLPSTVLVYSPLQGIYVLQHKKVLRIFGGTGRKRYFCTRFRKGSPPSGGRIRKRC